MHKDVQGIVIATLAFDTVFYFPPTTKKIIRNKIYVYYHGIDGDDGQKSFVEQFMQAKGPFENCFDVHDKPDGTGYEYQLTNQLTENNTTKLILGITKDVLSKGTFDPKINNLLSEQTMLNCGREIFKIANKMSIFGR